MFVLADRNETDNALKWVGLLSSIYGDSEKRKSWRHNVSIL